MEAVEPIIIVMGQVRSGQVGMGWVRVLRSAKQSDGSGGGDGKTGARLVLASTASTRSSLPAFPLAHAVRPSRGLY